MKILCLYNNECAIDLFEWLKRQGHDIILKSDRLNFEWCSNNRFDLTVSYTYRYILSEDLIQALNYNVVNLHNSLLPWNRGADPNIWSIVDGTPRGVTLHYMDSGLDKGQIIVQEIVEDFPNETLKTSYDRLDLMAKAMFKKAFKYVDYWDTMKKVAEGKGSYHSVKDGVKIKNIIDTYDMTVSEFLEKIKILGLGD